MSYRLIHGSPMIDTEEFIHWYAFAVNMPIPLPIVEIEGDIEEITEDIDERRALLDNCIDPVKKFFLKEVARLEDEAQNVSRKRIRMR